MLATMAKRAAIKKVLIPLSFFWSIATPNSSSPRLIRCEGRIAVVTNVRWDAVDA
jgi:hypothetical protein